MNMPRIERLESYKKELQFLGRYHDDIGDYEVIERIISLLENLIDDLLKNEI